MKQAMATSVESLPLKAKYLPRSPRGTTSAIMLPQAGDTIAPKMEYRLANRINNQRDRSEERRPAPALEGPLFLGQREDENNGLPVLEEPHQVGAQSWANDTRRPGRQVRSPIWKLLA